MTSDECVDAFSLRTIDDVEADIRILMAKHAQILPRGWQTTQQRNILHQRIDRLLDEYAMRAEVQRLVSEA